MSKIEDGLHSHHAQARNPPTVLSSSTSGQHSTSSADSVQLGTSSLGAPFAKVNSVVPGSPAEEAGLKTGDKIRRFGNIDWVSHEKLSKLRRRSRAMKG